MAGGMAGGMAPNMMQQHEHDSETDEEAAVTAQQLSGASGSANPPAAAAAPAPAPPLPLQPVEYTGRGAYNMDDTAAISKTSSMLRGLPRRRMTSALEKLDKELDAGYLAELSIKGLLILLWVYTRLRPATKIAHLRILAGGFFAILHGFKYVSLPINIFLVKMVVIIRFSLFNSNKNFNFQLFSFQFSIASRFGISKSVARCLRCRFLRATGRTFSEGL